MLSTPLSIPAFLRPLQILSVTTLIGSAILIGCDKPGEDTSSPTTEVDDTTDEDLDPDTEEESGGCDEVTVDFDGDEPPTVGTTWTLFPRCDGALIMGAVVIRVEPLESATLDENLITFEQAGICEISVQVGSVVGTLEVEVVE